ncbi:MAG: hypothetical protein WA624_04315 [Methylocella sp.]
MDNTWNFDIGRPVLRDGGEKKRRVAIDNLLRHVADGEALSVGGAELPDHACGWCHYVRGAQQINSMLLGRKTRFRFAHVALNVEIALSRVESSIVISSTRYAE